MALNRRLREEAHLPNEGWSEWKKAMVPANNNNNQRFLEARGPNQAGFMWSNIENSLAEVARLCGIYEWKATRDGQPNRVVYVGSTCTRHLDRCERLKNRIIRYCKYGNHKGHLINDALNNGYELFVRYKPARNEDEAKARENQLLGMFDYAWNVRGNGLVRDILPPLLSFH